MKNINIHDLYHNLREIVNDWLIAHADGETTFDHQKIKEYFERTFNQNHQLDARIEKIVASAVVKTSMSKMGKTKEEALNDARNAVEFLRDVRAKKLLVDGKITEDAYILYRRLIHSSWLRAAVKIMCKRAAVPAKKALKILLQKTPLKKIAPIIEMVSNAIPENVKTAVKQKAKEFAEKALEELPNIVGPLIERGYECAKKAVEKISEGVEIAVRKGREFVENHPIIKGTSIFNIFTPAIRTP